MVNQEKKLFFEGFLYKLLREKFFSFRYACNPCNKHDLHLIKCFTEAKENFPKQLNFFNISLFGNCAYLDELVSFESGIFLTKDYPEGYVPGHSTPRYNISASILLDADAKTSYINNKQVIDYIFEEYRNI